MWHLVKPRTTRAHRALLIPLPVQANTTWSLPPACEDSRFKRPISGEGEVSNGRPAKSSLVLAGRVSAWAYSRPAHRLKRTSCTLNGAIGTRALTRRFVAAGVGHIRSALPTAARTAAPVPSKPICSRMRAMTPGSVIAAITCRSPPQLGHRLKSMANTRFSRASQLIGVVHALAAISSAPPLCSLPWGAPPVPPFER